MNIAAATGEMFLSALAWRPVWMRYGVYGEWHALIKADIALITDLRKPTCGYVAIPEIQITGTGLVPGFSEPFKICTACLTAVLNVKDWTL